MSSSPWAEVVRPVGQRCPAVTVALVAAVGIGPALAALYLGAAPVAAQTVPTGQTVPIGLVLPADAQLGAAVRRGAEAAIDRANAEDGFRGRPFELRVVTPEGLWGQGLGRVVGLVFDDEVRGVVAGVDGRGAHLAQQVVTKSRIPLIIPWASDHTLSRGNIPWSFQTVPDDHQQAEAVVAHALQATGPGPGPLVVVTDTSYDGRRFSEALLRACATAGATAQLVPLGTAGDREHWPGWEPDAGRGAVVLATGPGAGVERVIQRLGELSRPPDVYGPMRLAAEPVLSRLAGYPARVLLPWPPDADSPFDWSGARAALLEAHAHDAVLTLIAAIRSAGEDPWRIRDALAEGIVDGRTGPVRFDAHGRRRMEPRIRPIGRTGW